jgi:hypothetical protein
VLTCKDVIDLLLDYLEATLDPGVVAEVEQHLHQCGPCTAYLNTYQRTREIAGEVLRAPMPEEMKDRLRLFLLERLGRPGAGRG